MANTGYGAVQDIDAKVLETIANRSKANSSPGGYVAWQTKRKPWIRAFSCASGPGVSEGFKTTSISSLADLYNTGTARPKPGITGLSTTEEGTHGGFAEGKLKFVCWTKEDFGKLAKSFLTYGMTITIEWGWSVDHTGQSVQTNGYEGTRCKSNDGELNKEIAAHANVYKGCYEAMRGQVTDFSWAMAANGSFEGECTITSMAGNTAKVPIKIATKDCTCKGEKTEDNNEKGPTYNLIQIADQYIDQASEDGGKVTLPPGGSGTVTGVGLTSSTDGDIAGSSGFLGMGFLFGYSADFNYVTFEAFEELFVNLQIQSIVDAASGNKGTTRDQAKALVGTGGAYVSSKQKFTSLFYSNHSVLRSGVKEIASADPRVCLLPGSKLQSIMVEEFNEKGGYDNLPSCFGGGGIYLANILINLTMVKEEFSNCGPDTGAGEFMKRILSRVNEACGGIWNFTMVPYSGAENIVQWLDIDQSPIAAPTSLTIPAYGKDSIARAVSTQTESDPDFQAQIMYGANNKNGKGSGNKSGGVALWAGGIKDIYQDSIRVSSECTPADYKVSPCDPESGKDAKDVETVTEPSAEKVFKSLGGEVSQDSVMAATSIINTRAKGETKAAVNEGIRVIPVPITLDVELDGIGGFVFGNMITVSSLPSEYNGWLFQITKVDHSVSNADWTTTLSAGLMRKL